MAWSQTSFCFLAFLLACSTLGSSSPYEKGSYSVKHATHYSFLTSGLDHNLDIWAPNEAGNFPVIYYLSGLAGLIEADFHSIILEHVSSHGFVVLAPWTLTAFPTTQYKATWLEGVDKWAQQNLHDKLTNDGFHQDLQLNYESTFLLGHSSGNHIIINYLNLLGCHNVKGVAMISPVDGVDPYGFIHDYCIEPGTKLNFETPTLILTAGLDGIPGVSGTGGLVPPCAPDNLSNLRFWDALWGNLWLVNATDYGHTDFLDPGVISTIVDITHLCATHEGPKDSYRTFVAGEVVAFLGGILGDCHMFQYLEDPSVMPLSAQTMKQSSSSEEPCGNSYCIVHQ